MVRRYRNQNYSKLKQDLQRRGEQFTDPEFPPTSQSVFFSKSSDIVWKRPGDICDNPKLIVNGLSSTDLNQGALGNCWFVAACSALALEQKLWDRVVPHWREQEWNDDHPERYAGIFHFHFWRMGEWVDVVVDDYLPTVNGELVFMKSKDKNEFWSALLEKAYAKLAGTYEALAGGQTGDALEDFTGGVSETIDVREGGYSGDEEKMKEIFERMLDAHEHRALISCYIAEGDGEEKEKVLECGLIKGHAYSIIDIRKVSMTTGLKALFKRDNLLMVKVRNPWGEKEWNGPWSDGSEEWNRVPERERNKMGLKVEDDGDFWMEFADWCSWFTNCSICYQVNTRVLSLQKTWHEALFHGEWRGRSAGGCVNNRDTFMHNPQYIFTIPRDDSEVMVSLMQKDVRSERKRTVRPERGDSERLLTEEGATVSTTTNAGEYTAIGYHVMKVEENRKYRAHTILEKAASITFTNRRSVFGKFMLNAGRYVVVPSTFDPALEREFLLRIYTERPNHAFEPKKDVPTRGCLGYLCCCCWKSPQALIIVHIDGAQALEKQDHTGADESYEGEELELVELELQAGAVLQELTAMHYRPPGERREHERLCLTCNPTRDTHMATPLPVKPCPQTLSLLRKGCGQPYPDQDRADPYCIVKCEGSKTTIPVKKDTLSPVFNTNACFYAKNPSGSEITVQVWNSNVVVDSFMGQVVVPIPRAGESERHTTRLMDRGRRSSEETHGTISFTVQCYHDLRAV